MVRLGIFTSFYYFDSNPFECSDQRFLYRLCIFYVLFWHLKHNSRNFKLGIINKANEVWSILYDFFGIRVLLGKERFYY